MASEIRVNNIKALTGLGTVTISSDGINVGAGIITATTFSGDVSGNITIGAGSTAAPSLAPSGDSNTGIFFPSADTIAFAEGGSEAARIDSSSRLLLGTSTSTTGKLLQVEGSSDNQASFRRYSNDAYGSVLQLGKTRGTSAGSFTVVQNGDELGGVYFRASDGSQELTAARITAEVDGTPGSNDTPGRLKFSTTEDGASSPTERMRIGNQGNVSIGANFNSIVRLTVTGQSSTSSDFAFAFYNAAGTALFQTRNDGVVQTGIASNSPYNLTTGAAANVHVDSAGTLYRSTSSRRFKTGIESLEDNYADAILSIEPVWYRSTAPGDEIHPDWSYYGFIAEDVAKVDPRLVFWKTHEAGQDEEGKPTFTALDEPIAEGVQYDRFVPHLLNLIKRQQQAIETLEASNTDLAARLTALEGGAAQ